jgi:hypothetical protein
MTRVARRRDFNQQLLIEIDDDIGRTRRLRYLGHRSIASTGRYTALAPDRFKGFWKD